MGYRIENSIHYYRIINKIIKEKGYEISNLMIATDRVYSYYDHEKFLARYCCQSPTFIMRSLIEKAKDIDEITQILMDFIKMSSELEMVLKDPENAFVNYKLKYINKYLLDNKLKKKQLEWTEIYNYSDAFIHMANMLLNKSGVYFLFNANDEIIYIGKSKNIGDRLFASISDRSKYSPKKVWVYITNNVAEASILEPYFISKFKPIANTEFNTGDSVESLKILVNDMELNYKAIPKQNKITIFDDSCDTEEVE